MADPADLDARLERLRVKLRRAAAHPRGAPIALGPPAEPAVLAAIERDHQAILPTGYRRFITELGDGGAGPGYGLLPLPEALAASAKGIYLLGDPFVAPTAPTDFTRFDGPGVLVLCERGHTRYDGLVVTGAERDRMWTYGPDRPGWRPIVGRPDFLAWYEAWLDTRAMQ